MFPGWTTKCSESPYSYLATKMGWRIESSDGKKFRVLNPDGGILLDDVGSSFEALRVAEAGIRRAS